MNEKIIEVIDALGNSCDLNLGEEDFHFWKKFFENNKDLFDDVELDEDYIYVYREEDEDTPEIEIYLNLDE